MDRTVKQVEITAIKDRFGRMASAVLTDFRGLNVECINELRRAFGKVEGIEYKVVKNTLVKLATAEQSYHDKLAEYLIEPTAIAWSFEDPVAPAKIAIDFRKIHENLKIKCAVVDGQVYDEAGVTALAKMLGKDQLRSQLLATFMAPASQFVRLLNAAPANFVYLLDARRRALGGE